MKKIYIFVIIGTLFIVGLVLCQSTAPINSRAAVEEGAKYANQTT